MYYLGRGISSVAYRADSGNVVIYSTCLVKPLLCELSGLSPFYPEIRKVAETKDVEIYVSEFLEKRPYTSALLEKIRETYKTPTVNYNEELHYVKAGLKAIPLFRDIKDLPEGFTEAVGYAFGYITSRLGNARLDLHTDNIMYRPYDGQMVINDPIHFDNERIHPREIDEEVLFDAYSE